MERYYSNSFGTNFGTKNNMIYKYSIFDFQKALDCLFFILDTINQKKNFMQPMNILVGKTDDELVLVLNYSKAIFGNTVLNTIFEEELTNNNVENFIKNSFLDELGMKTEGLIKLPINSFDNIIDELVSIWDSVKTLEDGRSALIDLYFNVLGNYYNDLKKCTDAVANALNDKNTKYGDKEMWVEPVFKTTDIKIKPNMCFGILPFNENRIKIFDNVIKPALKNDLGISVFKSGDMAISNSDMIEEIWKSINEAAFILADISDNNPNVFYEVGICHTLGKKMIPICDEDSLEKDYKNHLPFDLNTRYTIFYKNTAPGGNDLVKKIEKSVKELTSIQHKIR